MEDANNTTCIGNGRHGDWYAVDSTGLLTPPVPTLLAPARGTSTYGMHFAGALPPSTLGLNFANYLDLAYDASAYYGIKFFAKASGPLTIQVAIICMATDPDEYGGSCTDAVCTPDSWPANLTTSWQEITIAFSAITGGTAPFNKAEAVGVQFQVASGSYDYWIDDVSLY
jgi:hypothetical protein